MSRARHVQSWKPTLLQGYASILAELALFVQRKHLLDGLCGIEQYQFVQTGPGSVVLRFCASQAVVGHVEQVLKLRLQTDIRSDLAFRVERVEAVTRSPSGKHRFVIGMPVE